MSHATRMGPTPTLTQILSNSGSVPPAHFGPSWSQRRWTAVLYITQVRCLLQRDQRIFRGHEFMRHVTLKPSVGDGPHHAVPPHFLRVIELMPPGHTTGMKVSNPLQVLADRIDEIAFHNLHVVDVIQQLHVRRIYFLHHTHAPGRVVAHVI